MRLQNKNNFIKSAVGLCFIIILSACFTGIESTPKITQKEVKKQNVSETPEQNFLSGVLPLPPATWSPGKRFFISDNRVGRTAWKIEPLSEIDSLYGYQAVLLSVDSIKDLTGAGEIQLSFRIPERNASMIFRTGLNPQQWTDAKNYTIPHFIDMDLVNSVKDRLINNSFYILPARRLGLNGNDTIGTRYQQVNILNVLPATESTPFRVFFTDEEGHYNSVLMTVGDLTTSRRNFETIFSLENPRLKYKQIDDSTWNLICHGKVREGMSREECKLALGAPDSFIQIPSSGGLVERWSFANGSFLVFEDGILSRFRL